MPDQPSRAPAAISAADMMLRIGRLVLADSERLKCRPVSLPGPSDAARQTACGIGVTNNGTVHSSDGGKVGNNGTNFPIPTVADLVQVNPATDDSIALYAWQASGGAAPIASAWLKTEWVCAPSGTVVES